jgi:hypothetical protein
MREQPFIEDHVQLARLITLRSALGLEVKGFSRRGRSVYSVIKEEFGMRGSKEKVYNLFNTYCVEERGLQDRPLV